MKTSFQQNYRLLTAFIYFIYIFFRGYSAVTASPSDIMRCYSPAAAPSIKIFAALMPCF